jgi:uncharacterized membrane protein (DUF4010 family)
MDQLIIDTELFKLTQEDFFIRLVVALGIGFVIGFERQRAAIREKVESFAGIRTFSLTALLGFLGGILYFVLSPTIFFILLLFVGVLTALSYFVIAQKGDIGATTEISLLLSFILGTFCLLGYLIISLVVMVVVIIFLSYKVQMRSIAGKITVEEWFAFIRFVIIALLIFPFLPNKNYGPYNNLNPYEIGWVIILTSGIGFIGHLLIKFLGSHKGILFSGLLGGLVSSTAVTWIFARKSKDAPAASLHCAITILSASSIMFIRILVWTFIFNKGLFKEMLLPVAIIFIAAISFPLYHFFRTQNDSLGHTHVPAGKPLDLQGAFTFGIIYVAILLVVSYANLHMGKSGLLLSSAIAGLSDIDAIAITLSKLKGSGITFSLGAKAILIAGLTNTLIKMGIGLWMGSAQIRRHLIIGYGIVLVAMLGAFLLLIPE